jgi:acyl-CoA thioester hydrolase
MPKPTLPLRSAYRHFLEVPTRWMDNDIYGHVNNVIYYSYFDTVINRYLIEQGRLDIANGDVIGLCVESRCAYFAPLSFPQVLEAGLRVKHLGRSSVTYELAIFIAGAEVAAAEGHCVHVFVDRATRRPHDLPPAVRAALEKLVSP